MLGVKTSKNIENYEENVAGGLNWEQFKAILSAMGIGGGIFALICFLLEFPVTVGMIIASPFMAFFIYRGFYNRNGMSYKEHQKIQREKTYSGANFYRSESNCEQYFEKLIQDYEEKRLEIDDSEAVEEGDFEENSSFQNILEKYKLYGLLGICIISTLFAGIMILVIVL